MMTKAIQDSHASRHAVGHRMFDAGVIHDLGNQLQILRSAINILRAHPAVLAAADLDLVITGAATSLDRLSAMVQRTAGISHGCRSDNALFDAGLCIRQMEQALRWAVASDIVVALHIEPGLPPLCCDRHLFENVLLNLVLNAGDSIEGDGLIVVAARSEQDGAIVHVEVADNGTGMHAEVRTQAFEPFFTTKAKGSGLGLSMARSFAIGAGGSISIDSELEGGTNVRLRLPAVRRDQRPADLLSACDPDE